MPTIYGLPSDGTLNLDRVREARWPTVSASHRAKMATLGGLTNGTDTGAMTRVSTVAPTRMTEVIVEYSNIYSSASRETPGPNPITVRAAIEYDGIFYPLFRNGSRDAVIAPGGVTSFDPVFVDVPKGATYYVRTLVTVEAGGKWPFGVHTGAAYLGDGVEQGVSVTDKTTSGTVTTSNNYAFGPTAVRTRRLTDLPGAVSLGDSIAWGSGDSTDRGTIVRALDGQVPLHNLGYPGAQASEIVAQHAGTRLRLASRSSHWIVAAGTNDLSAGKTAQQIIDALLALYSLGNALGADVWALTIPPRTTSTDVWATPGGQTKAATESVRLAVNAWIRGTPAPLIGYFDTADAWETARDSGLWRNGYTTDGIHPNGTGAQAGADVIDPALLY